MAANARAEIEVIARDKASAAMQKIGRETDTAGKKMGKFGKVAVAGGAVAGAALIKFGKDSVAAFSEAEESQKRLEFAFQKFPKLADTNVESLRKLNTTLQKKTKFDDDAIASGQAVLAQFGITGKQIEKTTPLLLDYADATGKSVTDAAQDVGKALLGNAKALKSVGIFYKSTKDPVQDFANVTDLMRKKVGGFAEEEGTTAAGKAAILSNQFGELEETVGSKLLPTLVRVTEVGLKVVDFISKNQNVIIPLVAAVGTIIAALKAWTIVQAILNAELWANPIGVVVLALVGLVAGLVVAYKKSETFRDVVHKAMHVVGAAIGFVKDHWKAFALAFVAIIGGPIALAIGLVIANFGKIKNAVTAVASWVATKFTKIKDFITGMPAKIGNAAKGMFDGIKDAFKSAINWIIEKWNGLEIGMDAVKILGKTVIPSFHVGTPDIPLLAKGGTATRSGLAVVGDGGPELLNLDAGAQVIPLPTQGRRGGGGPTFIIQGALDPISVAKQVRTMLLKLQRETGVDMGLVG